MALTTPGTDIPVPVSSDPRTITADLWASFSKVGQLITQTSGESAAALTASEGAQTAASQALARALAIEEPVHVGPTPPTDGEVLWVDTDEDAPPTPVSVSSAGITDATSVGRAVLTAPLSVDARNALAIYTGTRALLDAGTDTAERTWDAKELSEYVTDVAESSGGAASWDDLAGKPATFPPSAHTHDDRYYTRAEVGAMPTFIEGPLTRRIALTTPAGMTVEVGNTGARLLSATDGVNGLVGGTLSLARDGADVIISAAGMDVEASGTHLLHSLPLGFRPRIAAYTKTVAYFGSDTGDVAVRAFPSGSVHMAGVPAYPSGQTYHRVNFTLRFVTGDAWPSTLPGKPG